MLFSSKLFPMLFQPVEFYPGLNFLWFMIKILATTACMPSCFSSTIIKQALSHSCSKIDSYYLTHPDKWCGKYRGPCLGCYHCCADLIPILSLAKQPFTWLSASLAPLSWNAHRDLTRLSPNSLLCFVFTGHLCVTNNFSLFWTKSSGKSSWRCTGLHKPTQMHPCYISTEGLMQFMINDALSYLKLEVEPDCSTW